MRIGPVVAVGLTAAAVGAVGASAYTAALTGTPATRVLGFGETSITGATMTSATYGYNDDHSEVTSITVVLVGNTSATGLQVSYNEGAPVACGAGVHDAGTPGATTYSCSGLTFNVNGMTSIGYVLG